MDEYNQHNQLRKNIDNWIKIVGLNFAKIPARMVETEHIRLDFTIVIIFIHVLLLLLFLIVSSHLTSCIFSGHGEFLADLWNSVCTSPDIKIRNLIGQQYLGVK